MPTIITLIYKGGVKSNAANYRSVALTNHLTNIFKRIPKKPTVEYMVKNPMVKILKWLETFLKKR